MSQSEYLSSSNTRKASAMAQVVNGFIVGAEIIDGGYGYTSNPEVTITGEGGFGAIATATVSAGQVIKINIQNPGFGYTGNPTIDIAAPPVPPASAYATAEVEDPPFDSERKYKITFTDYGILMKSFEGTQTWEIHKDKMVYTDTESGPEKKYAQRTWRRITE